MKDELQNKNQTNKKQNSINRNRIYSKHSGKEIKDSKNILEKEPLKDFEENESEEINPRSFIRVGEIEIAIRTNDIYKCKDIATSLLKNKSVQKYLNNFEKKKLFARASYLE